MKSNIKRLIGELYEILKSSFYVIKDEEVNKWIYVGITAYGLPALYRYLTRDPTLPFPFIQIKTNNEYIPSNLIEKLVVNSIFPGGVGAVIGEKLISKLKNQKIKDLEKYVSIAMGSLATTSIWTLIQYVGHVLSDMRKYEWPSGGNPFEGPNVYPFNFLIALTVAPLTPYIAELFKKYLKKNEKG